MVDSNEQDENPNGEELAQSRVAELERLAAEKDQEISLANARVTELGQAVTDLEGEVATLKQSNVESEQKLAEISSALSQAVVSYKARVIEFNPEVPVDLIAGETVEAVDSSLESAQSLVRRIQERLKADIRMVKIPAGAPQRAPVDLSALSPREKIQFGIGGFSS